MKQTKTNSKRISEIAIAAPRLTLAALFLLATALSIPVYMVLALFDWLWL